MPRKLLRVVSLLAIVVLVLAACKPPSPKAAQTAQPTQTAQPAETAQPTGQAQPGEWKAKYNLTAPDPKYGGNFKSIEAVDQYTVKFTLNNPDPAFLSKVAFGAFDIHSAAQLEATGGGGDILSKPIGSGPYMVKEWVRGDHLTLVPNPSYWGEAPKNKSVVMRWNKEAAARLVELQAGTADSIDNPSPDDFEKIQADANLNLIPRPPMNTLYLGMNNKFEPFDKEEVRQAVAMSIDKRRFVDNYFPKGSAVAEQFMPPALVPGFTAEPKWYTYDVEAAKKLLADAGYPDGFEVTLSYRDVVRGYQPLASKLAQEFQSQLAKVGIKVTLKVMESGAFLAATSAGEEPLFMLGWLQDYPDPTDWVDYHFTGASENFGEPYPDLEEAIAKAGQEPDPAKRVELYQTVNELIKQHVPVVPIAHGTSAIVYSAKVEGAHASPLNNEEFRVMSIPGKDQLNWVQNAEPISLYCNDETDGETFRACNQIFDTLYWYKVGTAELVPALAESYKTNADLTEWTFTLRKNAKFSDGKALDANDVVATFVSMWDAKSPMHKGNTGVYEYWGGFFGGFLNPPPAS